MKKRPVIFPALIEMNPVLIRLMLFRLKALTDETVEDLYEGTDFDVDALLASVERLTRALQHSVTALRLERAEDVEIAIECCEGNTYFRDLDTVTAEEWTQIIWLVNELHKITGRIIQPPNC